MYVHFMYSRLRTATTVLVEPTCIYRMNLEVLPRVGETVRMPDEVMTQLNEVRLSVSAPLLRVQAVEHVLASNRVDIWV